MLTDQNYPTSPDARGCTFETTAIPPFKKDGVNYEFLDTAGLNETDKGQ
ncbi:unnamed protein product, partial [Rotaria sp. Silwood1]